MTSLSEFRSLTVPPLLCPSHGAFPAEFCGHPRYHPKTQLHQITRGELCYVFSVSPRSLERGFGILECERFQILRDFQQSRKYLWFSPIYVFRASIWYLRGLCLFSPMPGIHMPSPSSFLSCWRREEDMADATEFLLADVGSSGDLQTTQIFDYK